MIFETETEVTLTVALLREIIRRRQEDSDNNPEVGMGWRPAPKWVQQKLGQILQDVGMSRRVHDGDDTHRLLRVLNSVQNMDDWRHYVRVFSDRHSQHQPFEDLPESSRFPLITAYGGSIAAQALTRTRNLPSSRLRSSQAPTRKTRPLIEL